MCFRLTGRIIKSLGTQTNVWKINQWHRTEGMFLKAAAASFSQLTRTWLIWHRKTNTTICCFSGLAVHISSCDKENTSLTQKLLFLPSSVNTCHHSLMWRYCSNDQLSSALQWALDSWCSRTRESLWISHTFHVKCLRYPQCSSVGSSLTGHLDWLIVAASSNSNSLEPPVWSRHED